MDRGEPRRPICRRLPPRPASGLLVRIPRSAARPPHRRLLARHPQSEQRPQWRGHAHHTHRPTARHRRRASPDRNPGPGHPDTPSGIEAALAAALTVHYCHHHVGPTHEIASWVQDQLSSRGGTQDWAQPWRGKVDGQGVMSTCAALTRASRRSDLLGDCIAFTSDVDTVATIALAAASRATNIEQDRGRSVRCSGWSGLVGDRRRCSPIGSARARSAWGRS